MASKKDKDEQATPQEAPVAVTATPPPPPPVKTKTVKVHPILPFLDGNLREAFQEAGYDGEQPWQSGEWRTIPLALLKRCLQSGGTFETEDGRELAVPE